MRNKNQMEKDCGSERMNCFHHDNDHWKTAPLWTSGPFCFCMNANNNTYSCVRTINATHNFLYCEFTTDPFELFNQIDQLKPDELSFLHDQLKQLIACKGRSCKLNQHQQVIKPRLSNIPMPNIQQQKYKNKKSIEDLNGLGIGGRHGNIRLAKIDMKGRGKNTTIITKTQEVLRGVGFRKRRKT
ncbi:unnamed protein product [Brassicogethes aeneus]|uniref:Uncharacterized protein n=1 Tax=Brassicogethes aeneus TaxID=1431903 RepID=A0A9P0B5Z9_BRAAE|nr:unnamed protein product [Brassicogethes aeneus]